MHITTSKASSADASCLASQFLIACAQVVWTTATNIVKIKKSILAMNNEGLAIQPTTDMLTCRVDNVKRTVTIQTSTYHVVSVLSFGVGAQQR